MLRETQDLVVGSLDFRMEKSALECPLWIVVLHLRYNKKKKRKNWRSVCKTKNLKVKWKLSWRQEAVSLWMMRVLKITYFQFFLSKLAFLSSASMKLKGTKIRKKRKRKNILCSHVLKEDVKTTRVSITFSIQITLLVYNCLLPKK